MSFRAHTKCRACQSEELQPVFDLGLHPLANDFQKQGEVRQGFYPLEIMFCPRCTLSQLSVVVDPETLYRDYKYVTSNSETMQRHFHRLWQDIGAEVDDCETRIALLEIGSNNGDLLRYFRDRGYEVTGVEPAKNLAKMAMDGHNGVLTVPEFFNLETARVMGKKMDVILARHVFAHIHDWADFMRAAFLLAHSKTLIALEVPYVHDLLKNAQFDTAYHEHLSYLSITGLVYLLRATPFRLHHVVRYGIHGGAVLVMLRHRDSGITPHLSADEYLAEDAVTIQHWERFCTMSRRKIEAMRQTILDYVSKGKIVCGFGASAKASVWINAMGLTRKEIQFVSDNSPLKPGRLMPGSDIPIIAQDELLSRHPDVAIGFAWNFRAECLNATTLWRERGGKFVFPTPEGVEIV